MTWIKCKIDGDVNYFIEQLAMLGAEEIEESEEEF